MPAPQDRSLGTALELQGELRGEGSGRHGGIDWESDLML